MLKCVVFSKDRPMQLHAYIESLVLNGILFEDQIYVIYKYNATYDNLLKKFDNILWYNEEENFNNTLRNFTNKYIENDDIVLTGCDDVIYTGRFNQYDAYSFLNNHKDHIGFSLRLGSNIKGCPNFCIDNERYISWDWTKHVWHFGYPFELMGSCYRGSLFKGIVGHSRNIIRGPNDLEGMGDRYCKIHNLQTKLACFNTSSFCVAQDINRVQDICPNRIQGTEQHTAQRLKKLYQDGKRIDWNKLDHITPPDCFVGYKYFSLNG